jgi:hypothetical protein
LPPIWSGDVPISPEQGEHKSTGQPLNPRTWVSGKAPPQPKEDGEQGSAADEELRVPTRSLALPIALATLVVAGLIAAGVWLKLPIEQQRASAAPSGSASVAASVPTAAPAPEVTPPEPAASVSASAAPALSASASPASSEADEDPDDDDSVVPPP